MRTDFEPIFSALLAHLKAAVPDIADVGRRVLLWTNVTKQPALLLRHTGVVDEFDGDGLQKTLLECELWFYVKATQNPRGAPATILNGYLKDIRAAFAPDNSSTQEFTLGGLVQRCRIEVKTDLAPGDTQDQSIAIIPVSILVI